MCVSLSVSYFKFGWATYVYYHKNDMFAQSSVRGSILGLNVIPVSVFVMGKKIIEERTKAGEDGALVHGISGGDRAARWRSAT